MFYCHKIINTKTNTICQAPLRTTDSDNRQEWSEEYLICDKCKATYTLRTEFKLQSHIIASQKLLDENGHIVE